jgi:hypothetical protein
MALIKEGGAPLATAPKRREGTGGAMTALIEEGGAANPTAMATEGPYGDGGPAPKGRGRERNRTASLGREVETALKGREVETAS